MPSCCVPTCKNSSAKGYLLKCFPKNDKRRSQWIKNINRSNWSPNHSHRVCEVHFSPSMWEKTRVDGSRKLKYNAVPTIFGDRIMEEPSRIQTIISSDKNINDEKETKTLSNTSLKNIVLSNNQTLIKIIPPANYSNSQPTPILLPASTIFEAQSINPTSAIIVNSQGKIVNSHSSPIISGTTSILKPQIKTTNTQSSPMIISTNASILKNQIKAANSKTPIIIPATTSILKSQNSITSSQQTSINLTNTVQVKAENTQPILIPMPTNVIKSEVQTTSSQVASTIVTNTIIPKIESDVISKESPLTKNLVNFNIDDCEPKSMNHQLTAVKSTGIILNKAQAKKMEDERFEKMDKLLLKQLRLNNALRKKLNLMSNKMQQLMKEQNSDYKAFLMDVFTEDQIRALELRHTNPKSITAWSHKTMMKAIKLKEECGTRGYEELLNQNMPLPSIRTISRWCTARNIPIP